MSKYYLELEKYAAVARQVAAEGCVLLENRNNALPLNKEDKVAVFGRIASTYYKSGLGSGGMVNTAYVVGILDALCKEDIYVEKKVCDIYDEWIEKNPFDHGAGWGQTPWSQKEMPVSKELFDAAKECNVALVVIGRTAGEDQDNKVEKGSYLLTDEEEALICGACEHFERTIVVLNVGNIIDMSWVKKYNPAAVLYTWQGGQEGGNGVADVLMGRVNPCGKLTDTIATNVDSYPSTPYFGNPEKNYYCEDIFVGYRYFESFAKDNVLYPFGYGLSYSKFDIEAGISDNNDKEVKITAKVRNTGLVAGKEVVQVYVEAPQGKLGKANRVLCGFAKTNTLKPNEEESLTIIVKKADFASFDDCGVTGMKNAFVLEEGEYTYHVGTNVRDTKVAGTITEEFICVEQLSEALAPVEGYKRFHNDNGKLVFEDTPLRTVSGDEFRKNEKQLEAKYTGDKGYKLCDVLNGKVSMEAFVAQLSDDDLISISRGEGMCSPKVTPGTAAAFGGITKSLKSFGIPALCATDGPSGIRMDCGTKAFSLPNGTMIGCTFNLPLIEELYEMTGKELRQNRIDTLLGPGINIHRNPLNGRNFEYISEDPFLTGKMAVAQIVGMGKYNSSATAKHFSANNQEFKRHSVNSIVSTRALREIYLKGFEMAVKEGECRSIMTTYGPLNGLWTAGYYDLNTQVLRNEWGYTGIVMTDWWAGANDEGKECDKKNHAAIVNSGNDIFMVCSDTSDNDQDNIKERLASGKVTRATLVRNTMNILNFALKSIAMEYETNSVSEEELKEIRSAKQQDDIVPEDLEYFDIDLESGELVFDGTSWPCKKDDKYVFAVKSLKPALYDIIIEASSDLGELAQIPITVTVDGNYKTMFSFRGTNGETVVDTKDFGLLIGNYHFLKLSFGADGLKIKSVKLKYREDFVFPFSFT